MYPFAPSSRKAFTTKRPFVVLFFHLPMDKDSFEQLVAAALRRLPRVFRQKLKNIAVQVEDEPSEDLLADMGIDEGTLFGLYQGVPLTERGWGYGNVLPDRIVIYQRPIEEVAQSREEIEEIVAETVVHEIGHYFGFDDEELYDMEDPEGKRE